MRCICVCADVHSVYSLVRTSQDSSHGSILLDMSCSMLLYK